MNSLDTNILNVKDFQPFGFFDVVSPEP